MIKLYPENETQFKSQGLGVLKDSISCRVVEGLNDEFELEMEYPISGQHYDKIQLRTIIVANPNMHDNPQPFRIYNITKPLEGIVTINAEHISYDLSGYTVRPFEANSLQDILDNIPTKAVIPTPFQFNTDIVSTKTYKTLGATNIRSLLAGNQNSLLETYKGEFKFDGFNVSLLSNRGSNKGVSIRYSKNMTALEQEISSENLYTAIFPFYSKSVTETRTELRTIYEKVYIVPESKLFYHNWCSKTEGGKPFIPILEGVPVEIMSEGSYYGKIATWTKSVPIEVFIRSNSTDYTADWLSLTEEGAALIPQAYTIYLAIIEGVAKQFVWNTSQSIYEEYDGDGFWSIPEPPMPPILDPRPQTFSVDVDIYVDLTTGIDAWIIDGSQEFSSDWISDMEGGNSPILTDPDLIYTIKTEGIHLGKKYIWDNDLNQYKEFSGDGIIWLPGFDENSLPVKIFSYNMEQEFSDPPTVDVLKTKALDFLENNDLRKLSNKVTVSFVKLSDTDEYSVFKDLEIVELGDIVNVQYDDLGVNVNLKVISYQYDVLLDKYEEISLGELNEDLSNNVITKNDGVSALVNDADYTDRMAVIKLVAETVTADLINSKNARISEAMIEDLKVARINAAGLIEASQASIDKLIARLMVTEEAEILKTLTAGNIRVKGDILMDSGQITINRRVLENSIEVYIRSLSEYPYNNDWFSLTEEGEALIPEEGLIYTVIGPISEDIYVGKSFEWDNYHNRYYQLSEYVFEVDVDGNVRATSVEILGGTISIGNDGFVVDNMGNVFIRRGSININDNFIVNQEGVVTAKEMNADKLYSDFINVKDFESATIKTNKVMFGDENVYLERTSDNQSESQVVTFTPIVTVLHNISNLTSNISISVSANKNVWLDRTVKVSFLYTSVLADNNPNPVSVSRNVTIASGNNVSNQENVLVNDIVSVSSKTVFPANLTEIRQLGVLNKLSLVINGVVYDIAGDNVSGGGSGNNIILRPTQPDVSEVVENDFWYDNSEE